MSEFPTPTAVAPRVGRYLASMAVLLAADALLMFLPRGLATGEWLSEGEYFLTATIGEAVEHHTLLFASLLGLAGVVAALATRLAWGWIATAPIAVYTILLLIETAREPTSHNLLPFELAWMGFVSAPQGLAALLCRRLKARKSPRLEL